MPDANQNDIQQTQKPAPTATPPSSPPPPNLERKGALPLLKRIFGTGSGTDDSLRVVDECRRMLRFSLDKGKTIPEGLATSISRIDATLRAAGLVMITQVPAEVFDPPTEPPPASATGSDFVKEILSVHGQLSALIAPATAQSLLITSGQGNKIFSNLPGVVQLAIIVAFLSALSFIATSPPIELRPSPSATPTPPPKATPTPPPISPGQSPKPSTPTPSPK